MPILTNICTRFNIRSVGVCVFCVCDYTNYHIHFRRMICKMCAEMNDNEKKVLCGVVTKTIPKD